MLRLLKIELKKLSPNRFFRLLAILWIFAFIAIPIAFYSGLKWIEEENQNMGQLLDPTSWPLFDFADIWQNLAYLYKMITIFLGFIIMTSVTNDYNYKTIRQNIIDGLSRREFWLSKVSLIFFLSFLATTLLTLLGLIVGFIYSPVTSPEFIFMNIEFVGAYFFQVFYFLMFFFVLSLIIKRAGFVFPFILFWVYILEFVATMLLTHHYKKPLLADLFPGEAGWNLIRVPFEKYFLRYVQDFVSWQDLGIAAGWLMVFFVGSYLLVTKRDL